MKSIATLLRIARYEYWMHARRWSVWVLPTLAVGLTAATGSFAFPAAGAPDPVGRETGAQALSMNLLALVVTGALCADRWVRDQSLMIGELLDSQPTGASIRLWGKYVGVATAAATPLAVIWAVLTARLIDHQGQWAVADVAASAFAEIVLPGLLFVTAFSLTVPRVLGLRLYQILFIGYWFWGNLVPPHLMPTLAGTWLTPVGKYADAALFAHSDHALLLTGGQSPLGAYASIALLTGLGLLVVAVFAHESINLAATPSPGKRQR